MNNSTSEPDSAQPTTLNVPPFLALVFFRHDGSLDYDRLSCDDLESAVQWVNEIYDICDATAQSAHVYEFYYDSGEIQKTLRYERRKETAVSE